MNNNVNNFRKFLSLPFNFFLNYGYVDCLFDIIGENIFNLFPVLFSNLDLIFEINA